MVFATKEVRSRTAKADVLALLLLKGVAVDVVFATKEVRSRTAKAGVLALLLLKGVARCLVGEVATNCPYKDNPLQIDGCTEAVGLERSIDAWS